MYTDIFNYSFLKKNNFIHKGNFSSDILVKDYNILKEQIFHGLFSEHTLTKALNFIDTEFSKKKSDINTKKKISFLTVEILQNIIRHSIKFSNQGNIINSLFLVQKTNNFVYISSANVVNNKDVQKIRENLSRINKMSKEELNKEYFKILSNGKFSKNGGAGLGFISICRKKNTNYIYNFKEINKTHSVFYFQVIVNFSSNAKSSNNKLTSIKRIQNLFIKQNKQLFIQAVL